MAKQKNTELLLGQMVSYGEAKLIHSFFKALSGLIDNCSDNADIRSAIDIGMAFLNEHDKSLRYIAGMKISASFKKTSTLNEDSVIIAAPKKEHQTAVKTEQTAHRTITLRNEALRITEDLIGSFDDPRIKSALRKKAIENAIQHAKEALSQGDYTITLRSLKRAKNLQKPTDIKKSKFYKPHAQFLLRVATTAIQKDVISGIHFENARQALSNAIKITPSDDIELRDQIAEIGNEVAENAYLQNRNAFAATVDEMVIRCSPFTKTENDEALKQSVENWESEVTELALVDLEKAEKRTKMVRSYNFPSDHPMTIIAEKLHKEFSEKVDTAKENVVSIAPKDFKPAFQQRVLKVV